MDPGIATSALHYHECFACSEAFFLHCVSTLANDEHGWQIDTREKSRPSCSHVTTRRGSPPENQRAPVPIVPARQYPLKAYRPLPGW